MNLGVESPEGRSGSSSSPPLRSLRSLLFAATRAALAAALTGCAVGGPAQSAGEATGLTAPAQLWPKHSPAPRPTASEERERPSPIPGVPEVDSGDIRRVDAA